MVGPARSSWRRPPRPRVAVAAEAPRSRRRGPRRRAAAAGRARGPRGPVTLGAHRRRSDRDAALRRASRRRQREHRRSRLAGDRPRGPAGGGAAGRRRRTGATPPRSGRARWRSTRPAGRSTSPGSGRARSTRSTSRRERWRGRRPPPSARSRSACSSAPTTRTLFVACSQDDEVVELAAADLSLVATAPCPRKPWALAWAADGETLVATHLLGPGVSALRDRAARAHRHLATLADGAARRAATRPSPTARCAASTTRSCVRARSELWVAHLMLGIDTPQPDARLQAHGLPGAVDPRSDGQPARAAVGAGEPRRRRRVRRRRLRAARASPSPTTARWRSSPTPTARTCWSSTPRRASRRRSSGRSPGHLPEGIVWAGGKLYVQERNTRGRRRVRDRRRARRASPSRPTARPSRRSPPTRCRPTLRLGQKLFYSANSDDVPLTQNHWVACASCHVEGRSDAVTWKFEQGPRDTPTNAGGLLDTGFLFRTADRNQVQDYWKTINVEQGGHFSITDPTQKTLLDALAAYVNYAIPAPVPPSTDASHTLTGAALAELRAQGQAVFGTVGCDALPPGPGQDRLGRWQPVARPDRAGRLDADGGRRALARRRHLRHRAATSPTSTTPTSTATRARACAFDTPALRGLDRLRALPARRQRADARRGGADHAPGDGAAPARRRRRSRRRTGRRWSSTCAASSERVSRGGAVRGGRARPARPPRGSRPGRFHPVAQEQPLSR